MQKLYGEWEVDDVDNMETFKEQIIADMDGRLNRVLN